MAQAGGNLSASDLAYDAMIRSAREGKVEPALQRMDQLIALEPWNPRFVHDYVTLLNWAGRHDDAVRWWPVMNSVGYPAPAYALKALARSAREAGSTDIALAAYTQAVERDAADIEAHAGVVLTSRDADRLVEAEAHARAHLPRASGRLTAPGLPLARALGLVLEARGDALGAAALYQDILAIAPDDRDAARRRVLMLGDAGLPQLALQGVKASPNLFSGDEVRRLQHDRSGRMIQWGTRQIAVDRRIERFAATERALAANAGVIDGAPPGAAVATEFDRLVVLRDRVRMAEARDLFVDLERRGVVLPAYALTAAGDAYLYLEQPERARDLYLRAAADSGRREPGILFSLFYAYVECEQHALARQVADELLAITPPIINKGYKGVELDNPDYPAAITTLGLQLIFADRLDPAQLHLAEALRRAPFNFGLRAAQGTLLASRDRPRASLDAFDALLVDHPDHLNARIGRAENLLTLRAWPKAGDELAQLRRDYPEYKGVLAANDKYAVHASPLLTVDSTFGRSPSAGAAGPISSRDAALDVHYYGSPFKDYFRAFGHLRLAEGRVDLTGVETTVRRDRIGIGGDLRRPGWEARAELHAPLRSGSGNGLALALTREFSDAWRVRARYDSNTSELAWRAFGNGISARAVGLDATYTVHESRSFGASLARLDYSDSNRRDSAAMSWRERWVSGPVYKFGTVLSAGTSANSRDALLTPYFNPAHDRSLDAALINEWLTWRRYTRSFTQRLVVGVGTYGQSGAATLPVRSWRYEHEWSRDRRIDLRYGIGSSRHPYDGVQQTRHFLYLNLAWSPPW